MKKLLMGVFLLSFVFITGSVRAGVTGISITPSSGSATYTGGSPLTASDTTLLSDHDDAGLVTNIKLTNSSDEPVNFDSVFSSFNLTTDGDGPYDLVVLEPGLSTLIYGPAGGYQVTSGTPQVTTLTGGIKSNAPAGTYTITTEVLKDGVAQATATFSITITYPVFNETTGIGYLTIGTAIADAGEGDTIKVAAGTYNENVDLNVAGITLQANGEVKIKKSNTGEEGVVAVTANDITLDGFTIDNENAADGRAIRVKDGISGSVIKNNVLENSLRGIQGNWPGNAIGSARIEGNTFKTSYGLAGTEGWVGLEIINNRFETTVEGIGIGGGAEVLSMTSNKFVGTGMAVADYRAAESDPINATKNWWGNAAGPGTTVSEGVTFDPWCTNEACTKFSNDPVTPAPSRRSSRAGSFSPNALASILKATPNASPNSVVGQVLGASDVSPEVQAQINTVKTKLSGLINQLISMLQAQLAAAIAAEGN